LAWQVTVFMGLQSLASYVLVTWLSSIEHAAGISSVTAGFHQLSFNLSGLAGSLVCSALIHRLPDQRAITDRIRVARQDALRSPSRNFAPLEQDPDDVD